MGLIKQPKVDVVVAAAEQANAIVQQTYKHKQEILNHIDGLIALTQKIDTDITDLHDKRSAIDTQINHLKELYQKLVVIAE